MTRARLLGLIGVVVLSIVTGFLIADSGVPAGADSSGTGSVPSNAAETLTSTPGLSVPPDTPDGLPRDPATGFIIPKTTNVPMKALAPGEKAPQFVIFSFDGAGNHDKMLDFEATAAPTDSRFVGFLTGTYLLADTSNNAYSAPGAKPGTSSVGFGGDLAEVERRVNDLNRFYSLGNEVGTHYNGHFCQLGANWSTADWDTELDQFYGYLSDWKKANNVTDGPVLSVPPTSVVGGRTPCLAGMFDQLTPAWKSHGMIYDSSGENSYTGIAWPTLEDGIWQFAIPTVYSPAFKAAGFTPLVKAMDYNFWYKFNKAVEQPATQPTLTGMVLDTYRFMFDQAYNGNRAPILVANHFNDWNGNSFNPAAKQFMQETCGKPDTYCTTYQDVIAWMKLQTPAVLAALQAQAPVAAVAAAS